MIKRGWTAAVFLFVSLVTGSGNAEEYSELYAEIATADTAMFEAFNTCDVETMGEMLAEDLEFYHDVAGLGDYATTMRATAENCERQLGLKRELVEGSLEVYPIKDYGAIQVGRHTFCHLANGVNDCGTFEFLHVWRRTDEGWKIARVVSYDH